jgi:hypothetical protein
VPSDTPTAAQALKSYQQARTSTCAIIAAHALTHAAAILLDEAIVSARKDGISWGYVGQLLGISRQAAWQRFHRLGV